jgi:tRNA-dihydrouridine synthase A
VLEAAAQKKISSFLDIHSSGQQIEMSCKGIVARGTERFSVAPMQGVTDTSFRRLARLLSQHATIYSEMVVDKTILNNPKEALSHLQVPRPSSRDVLQLGGHDPDTLHSAASAAKSLGYTSLNLNCGCPSDTVAGKGAFGASLMLEPERVADCISAMHESSALPVSVKHRTGVDDVTCNTDTYEQLLAFVDTVHERSSFGCDLFIVHARKAMLNRSMSPRANRTVPELKHNWVHSLARDRPHLRFVLNGGLASASDLPLDLISQEDGKSGITGIMLGRQMQNDLWSTLAGIDGSALFNDPESLPTSRRAVLEQYARECDAVKGSIVWQESDGHLVPSVLTQLQPLFAMFTGVHRARKWKQAVDDDIKARGRSTSITLSSVLENTLHILPDEALDSPPQIPEISATAEHRQMALA